jgi:drug/metabolite transporter (DMT)-like permease
VSVTLACLSTGAFFTSFLAPILSGRKVIWYEVFFGVIVIIGLSIIFHVESQYLEGILLGLSSAFLSALFSVFNSKFAKIYDPTLISFYELTGGILFFSLLLLGTSSFSSSFFQISTSDWVYLAILSSLCTAYAFIASVKVMRFLSPYTVMLTINLEPIYGIILAVLVFQEKEKMNPQFYLGALIILVTVIANGIVKYYRSKD